MEPIAGVNSVQVKDVFRVLSYIKKPTKEKTDKAIMQLYSLLSMAFFSDPRMFYQMQLMNMMGGGMYGMAYPNMSGMPSMPMMPQMLNMSFPMMPMIPGMPQMSATPEMPAGFDEFINKMKV